MLNIHVFMYMCLIDGIHPINIYWAYNIPGPGDIAVGKTETLPLKTKVFHTSEFSKWLKLLSDYQILLILTAAIKYHKPVVWGKYQASRHVGFSFHCDLSFFFFLAKTQIISHKNLDLWLLLKKKIRKIKQHWVHICTRQLLDGNEQ